jgi:hypothetical protein
MRRTSPVTGDPGSTHQASVESLFNISGVHIICKIKYNGAIAAQRRRNNSYPHCTYSRVAVECQSRQEGRTSWLFRTQRPRGEAASWIATEADEDLILFSRRWHDIVHNFIDNFSAYGTTNRRAQLADT